MKLILILATLAITAPTFANTRPGGRPEARREGVNGARTGETLVRFNRSCSEVLDTEVLVRLPESLKNEEAIELVQKAEQFSDTLKSKEVELKEDSIKRTEISTILEAVNGAHMARSRFVDFINSAREGKVEGSQKAQEVAEDLVRLIDNAFVILDAKVKDSPDAPVSTGQILSVLNILGGVNKARLEEADIIAFEASVKAVFGNAYSIKQVARCR